MLLVIDAGNTNVTFGLYEGDALRTHWRIRTQAGRTADEYAALLHTLFSHQSLAFGDVAGVALASVVPAVTPDLLRLGRQAFGGEPLRVSGRTEMGLRIAYQPATDVGADRLVDAVAAVHQFGAPCIVIDFGTATTFNAIAAPDDGTERPVYLGGAICLGIGVSLEALFSRAAKIPPVEIATPPRAIGDNTAHALQSGIVFGYVAQVEGMVARFRAEMGVPDCPVVATGGYSALFAQETRCITAVDPLLTLHGLRLVYERQRALTP
ncbi:MAG: type III pantothenate kinase [Armatimonadota bacterium]|nr:type III pantothenate kinase [Armatimonadota bacterium]